MNKCEHNQDGLENACKNCIEHIQGRAYITGIQSAKSDIIKQSVAFIQLKAGEYFINKNDDVAYILRKLALELKETLEKDKKWEQDQ